MYDNIADRPDKQPAETFVDEVLIGQHTMKFDNGGEQYIESDTVGNLEDMV